MLDIHKRDVGKVSVLSLNGDLDLDGAQNFKTFLSNLFEEGAHKVVINWSEVDRVSFTSIQQVTRPLHDLVNACPTAFCGMSEGVKKTLRTAPFFEKVKEFDSEDRALSRF